jgi:hypothetical protein
MSFPLPSAVGATDSSTGADPLHRGFVSLLPVVQGVARAYFRDVRCPDRRADAVAEAAALAWSWYVRLTARGKDPAAFAGTLARLATRAAACGRRLAGQDRAGDVLAPTCRRRWGFAIVALPPGTPDPRSEIADALADNTRSPVPAQVQFRVDFPVWRDGLSAIKRSIADQLALGHRTGEVAGRVGVTPARVAQVRGELRRDYLKFLTGGGDRPPGRGQPPHADRPH